MTWRRYSTASLDVARQPLSALQNLPKRPPTRLPPTPLWFRVSVARGTLHACGRSGCPCSVARFIESPASVAPSVPNKGLQTHGRATGCRNRRTAAALPQAQRMWQEGSSLREISRAVGLSKHTVMGLVPRRTIAQAMRLKHQKWKFEGRPNVPPRQRNKETKPA